MTGVTENDFELEFSKLLKAFLAHLSKKSLGDIRFDIGICMEVNRLASNPKGKKPTFPVIQVQPKIVQYYM